MLAKAGADASVAHAHGIPSRRPHDEAFWSRINRNDPNGCWVWTGSKDSWGYGQPRIDGRLVLAHRLSWELHYGPIPRGLCVLHRCDVRACVNPDHLFLGTVRDNNHDMIVKGRAKFPPRRAARLSSDDIAEIKRLRATGWTQQRIADRFGVNQTWVSALLSGRRQYIPAY